MINRPMCVVCKINLAKKGSKEGTYRSKCSTCSRGYSRKRVNSQYKKDHCEWCGFKAVHPCQLDVDHKNGDSTDFREENLQTLCANCHRLKTQNSQDSRNLKWRIKNGQ